MSKFFKWVARLFRGKPEEIRIPKLPVTTPPQQPDEHVIELTDVVKRPERVVKKAKRKFETSYIKIFGMQRTGTTFLGSLCSKNFKNSRILTNEFGWKHGHPLSVEKFEKWPEKCEKNSERYNHCCDIVSEIKNGNKIKFIIIIKNPYSWYYSIRRYLRSHFSMSNLPKEYQNYSDKYKSYKELYELVDSDLYGGGYIVRYEDLIKESKNVLNDIANKLDIELKSGSITIPKKVDQSRFFDIKQKKFYLSGGHFKLTQYLVDLINNNVDWKVLNFFGYEKVEKGE